MSSKSLILKLKQLNLRVFPSLLRKCHQHLQILQMLKLNLFICACTKRRRTLTVLLTVALFQGCQPPTSSVLLRILRIVIRAKTLFDSDRHEFAMKQKRAKKMLMAL